MRRMIFVKTVCKLGSKKRMVRWEKKGSGTGFESWLVGYRGCLAFKFMNVGVIFKNTPSVFKSNRLENIL